MAFWSRDIVKEKEKGKVCLRSCFISLLGRAVQRQAASGVVSLSFAQN